MKKYSLIFSILIFNVFGLEIDEKLPLRILRISDSQKTILINRGSEDGLVEGDHAKFFVTSGVIARAVVVKISPSRSVWAVYRIIDGNYLVVNKLMKLKISSPVKLTADKSKMISYENPMDTLPRVPLDVLDKEEYDLEVNNSDEAELASLRKPKASDLKKNKNFSTMKPQYVNRHWEAWGSLYLNSLSTSTNIEGSIDGASNTLTMMLAIEKYFTTPNEWYSNLSLFPFLSKDLRENSTSNNVSTSTDILEFGLGISYHFGKSPLMLNYLSYFISGTLALGSSEEIQIFNTGSQIIEQVVTGATSSNSLGIGLKYNFLSGWGIRAIADFYYRRELYAIDGLDVEKTAFGPRLQFGASYRF